MNSLPLEVINIILNKTNPKDYTNFILAYNKALELYNDKKLRQNYKEQFIRHIITELTNYYIKVDSGKYHGKFIEYYDDGEVYLSIDYVNGKKHGKYWCYGKGTNICHTTEYINDKRHGKDIKTIDDNIIIDHTYENDVKHGRCLDYYNNHTTQSQIRFDITYVNGLCHGKYKSYFTNGQLLYEMNFINNKKHGELFKYYDNGQLYYSKTYADNRMIGRYMEYDRDGNIRHNIEYVEYVEYA